MISAIVAVNEDWGIGYNNDLLEHIPADLKFFKTMTTGKTVVMGLNTWDSLPKKPLPNRFNIIIEPTDYYKEPDAPIAHMDLDTFINSLDDTEYVVMGGGSIYRQLLPYCDRVYVTKIYKKHEMQILIFQTWMKWIVGRQLLLENWRHMRILRISSGNMIEIVDFLN